MKDIHDRMPVILPREAEKKWLDTQSKTEEVIRLLVPYDASLMKAYPVSDDVNKAIINAPELILPASPGTQPTLF